MTTERARRSRARPVQPRPAVRPVLVLALALLALLAGGCSTYGVVSERGGGASCAQPALSAAYDPMLGCTAPAPALLNLPRGTPVCDHNIWTQVCRRDPDCPGGMGCDGALCRQLCGGAPGDCMACTFGCVDGLCVP